MPGAQNPTSGEEPGMGTSLAKKPRLRGPPLASATFHPMSTSLMLLRHPLQPVLGLLPQGAEWGDVASGAVTAPICAHEPAPYLWRAT